MKNKFFSKINSKDYNNQLELIIQEKKISTTGKNLLLSMLYKIETNFEDYKTVKRIDITKDEFLQELLMVVKEKCDKIELVEPNSTKGKILSKYKVNAVTDVKKKEIISYPTEKALLYALSDLAGDNYDINDRYYIIKDAVKEVMKVGNAINSKEILRDFNGWSWDLDTKDIENYKNNIVFQNIQILFGAKNLLLWRINNNVKIDYLNKFKDNLCTKYGKKNGEDFYNKLIEVSLYMYILSDKERRKFIENEKKVLSEEQLLIKDKTKFLDKITELKKKLNKEIEKIDKILNDTVKLNEILENKNANRKNKLTLKEYKCKLKKKREEVILKIKRYTNLMNPKKYESNKEEIENKLKILENLNENILNKDNLENEFIDLQNIFLECIKAKIQDVKDKNDIMNLIYHIRYYENLPYNNKEKIIDNEVLSSKIKIIGEMLIAKASNLKCINIISKNGIYNLEIIKNIFKSKIIKLENIELEMFFKENELQVNIYDDNNLENDFKLKVDILAKRLDIKTNKRIKLFT